MNSKKDKILLISWIGATLVALVVALTFFFRVGLEENILTLVPEDAVNVRIEEANRNFLSSLERKVFFAVSKEDAASTLSRELTESQLFTHVYSRITREDQKALFSFLNTHRLAFVDLETEKLLKDPNATLYSAWVLSRVFSPFAAVGAAELEADPLLLLRRSEKRLLGNTRGANLQNGWITAKDKEGVTYRLIEAELKGNVTLTSGAEKISGLLQKVSAQYPEASIVKQGIAFYTASGVMSAMHDVSLLGSLSFAGLLLIFWFGFRSVRPFSLCLLSIATGLTFASAATYLVFGSLHAATLVLSTSLIGISADYTTYFLTRRMEASATESPLESRNLLKKSLLHAVFTSSIAYGVMLFAPLPGLRQFALFGSVGLLTSCLTVLIVFPFLVARFKARPLPLLQIFSKWTSLWEEHPTRARVICLTMAILCTAGIARLETSDSLSEMQTLDTALKADEAKFTELFHRDMTQHWFVVLGRSADEALAREATLEARLNEATKEGALGSFDALPIAGEKTQKELLSYYQKKSLNVREALSEAGIPLKESKDPAILTLKSYVESPLGRTSGFRVTQLSDGSVALIVTVSNVKDESSLKAIARETEGVTWYSRKASFESLFHTCRTMVSILLAVAFAGILLVFLKSFGLKAGFAAVTCSALSLSASLGAMGWLGIPLHLFSLFALILILGIGIDYVVFFHNHKNAAASVSFAVTIAMLTTLLSLGILVLSSTEAISNFGLTLFLGISASYLIAPLVLTVKK